MLVFQETITKKDATAQSTAPLSSSTMVAYIEQIPKPASKKIKNEVDKILGPNVCTDKMVDAILGKPNPIEYIKALEQAKKDLAAATGKNSYWTLNAITKPILSEMFVNDPQAVISSFTSISKASRKSASHVFEALSNHDIATKFAADPESVTLAFIDILNTTASGYSNITDMTFKTISDPAISPLFAKDPHAVAEIIRYYGGSNYSALRALSDPVVAGLFFKNPAALAELSKSVGKYSYSAFTALSNPIIAEMFAKDPKAVTSAFVELSKYAGESTFTALSSPIIAAMFVKDTQSTTSALNQFAKASGNASSALFNALVETDLGKLFAADPQTVISGISEISKNAYNQCHTVGDEGRKYSTSALNALANPIMANLFAANPRAIIADFSEISHEGGSRAFMSFDNLSDPYLSKAYAQQPDEFFRLFMKVVKLSDYSNDQDFAVFASFRIADSFGNDVAFLSDILDKSGDYALNLFRSEFLGHKIMANKAAIKQLMASDVSPKEFIATLSALSLEEFRQAGTYKMLSAANLSQSELFAQAKAAAKVLTDLGLIFMDRYDPLILQNIYSTATSKPGSLKNTKTALVILNQNDYNTAFTQDMNLYRKLIEEGHSLIICETNDEEGVASRYFNDGRLEKEKSQDLTYDLVILGGHSTSDNILFGSGDETGSVGLEDYGQSARWKKGSWASKLKTGGSFIVMGCSAGQLPEAGKERAGAFQNVHQMFADLIDGSGATAYAPDKPTHLIDFIFADNHATPIWSHEAKNMSIKKQ